MQKVNLETIYRFLENPQSFTEEEISFIHEYLIAVKEKLDSLNARYNLNLQLSEYLASIFNKIGVAV